MFIWTLFHIQWVIWWNIHLPMSNCYGKYILRCVSLWVIHTHTWKNIEKASLISLGMVLHMAILCEILEISWLLWSLLRGQAGEFYFTSQFIYWLWLFLFVLSSSPILSFSCPYLQKKKKLPNVHFLFNCLKPFCSIWKLSPYPPLPSLLSSICLASFLGSATISLQ